MILCVCVCVCVSEREREGESVCACVSVCVLTGGSWGREEEQIYFMLASKMNQMNNNNKLKV